MIRRDEQDRNRDIAPAIAAPDAVHFDNSYDGFDEAGLNVVAGFDVAPPEKNDRTKPIYPMTRLETFCKRYEVRIGIIAVPGDSAQDVCDSLIACGVEAIWNFAPVQLRTPDQVIVKNENLALSLTALRIQLKRQERQIQLN